MKQKCKLLLFLAVIAYQNLSAQPTIGTQKAFGGNLDDDCSSVQQTKDGGYILGGSSESNKSHEKTENSRGQYDYWIIKVNNKGEIQWDKTIGGSDVDYLASAQQTSDGGYILGGYSYSGKSGEKTKSGPGGGDYWVVKLDSSGNIQWDKTIGGTSRDELYSLQPTSDGGYILGGYSESNTSGEKTENGRGRGDYWVVKLNSSRNIQWDKTIGGNDYDLFRSLQSTNDGGYIVGGYSRSNASGDKSDNNKGGGGEFDADYWVVKLNSGGKIQWDKTIGGSKQDYLGTIQQTSEGGYILGGGSSSNKSGDKTENNKGQEFTGDYWMVKLNSNGKIQWDRTIGGNNDDYVVSLAQTNGGYILAGNSSSNKSSDKSEDNRCQCDAAVFDDDYWAVKLDSLGDLEWDKTIGGNDLDYVSGIKEIGKDRYLLWGSSHSKTSGDRKRDLEGVMIAGLWL